MWPWILERFAVVIAKGWDAGLSRIERKALTRDGRELLFTAALLPRAKIRKPPKSPSISDRLKERWHLTYEEVHYSHVKRE